MRKCYFESLQTALRNGSGAMHQNDPSPAAYGSFWLIYLITGIICELLDLKPAWVRHDVILGGENWQTD